MFPTKNIGQRFAAIKHAFDYIALIAPTAFPARTLSNLFIHVILPLLLGTTIYVLLRQDEPLFFAWLEDIFALDAGGIAKLRLSTGGWAPDWVKYRLADGLWIYSLTSLMILLWDCKLTKDSIAWICAGLSVAVFSEFCQALKLLPGVFDPGDIAVYFVAFSAALANFFPSTLIKIMRFRHEKGTR